MMMYQLSKENIYKQSNYRVKVAAERWLAHIFEIVLPSRFFRGEDYIKENNMEEYTAKVSFYINVMASDKDIARIALLNQLQFPGHVVSELDIEIKDLPDDK